MCRPLKAVQSLQGISSLYSLRFANCPFQDGQSCPHLTRSRPRCPQKATHQPHRGTRTGKLRTKIPKKGQDSMLLMAALEALQGYPYPYLTVSMYLCIYVCIYVFVYLCICMYIYISTYMYTYESIHIQIYVYLDFCMPIHLYLYLLSLRDLVGFGALRRDWAKLPRPGCKAAKFKRPPNWEFPFP